MPINNVTGVSPTPSPGDVAPRPNPSNNQYVLSNLATAAEGVSKGLDQYSYNTATKAVELGEDARMGQFEASQDAYKRKLMEAADKQDVGTMMSTYEEAARIKRAAQQGLLSPSAAQVRLKKLEKDTSFFHPQLSGHLRAVMSDVEGNASQLIKMMEDDPSSKLAEDLISKSAEKGMTVGEFMAVEKATKLSALAETELDVALKTRQVKGPVILAQMSNVLDKRFPVVVTELLQGMDQMIRQSGGRLAATDLKQYLVTQRDGLYSAWMGQLTNLVAEGHPVDYNQAQSLVEDKMKVIDNLIASVNEGSRGTIGYAQAAASLNKHYMDLQENMNYKNLVSTLLPGVLGQLAANSPPNIPAITQMLTLAATGTAVEAANPSWFKPESPMFSMAIQEFGPEWVTAQMFKDDTFLTGLRTGDTLKRIRGEVPAVSDSTPPEVRRNIKANSFASFDSATPELRGNMVWSYVKDPNVSVEDLSNWNHPSANAIINDNPEYIQLLADKAYNQLGTVLGYEDMFNTVAPTGAVEGDNIRPFQPVGGSGSNNSGRIDKSLKANELLKRTYMISPDAYALVMDLVRTDWEAKQAEKEAEANAAQKE